MKQAKVSALRERGLRPDARAPVNAILFSLGCTMLTFVLPHLFIAAKPILDSAKQSNLILVRYRCAEL